MNFLQIKPQQTVTRQSWSQVSLRTDNGQKLPMGPFTFLRFFQGKSIRKHSVEISHLLLCACAVRFFLLLRNPVVYLFNFGRGAIWNVIHCEYKHLSSDPVSSEDWRVSNVRPRHGQTPPVSCWRLAAFAPNLPPPAHHHPPTIYTGDLSDRPPLQICRRFFRVNRINPCPPRFKAKPARWRIILRLPSSIRRLSRNVMTTLLPPWFLGKLNDLCKCGCLSGLMRLCANLHFYIVVRLTIDRPFREYQIWCRMQSSSFSKPSTCNSHNTI